MKSDFYRCDTCEINLCKKCHDDPPKQQCVCCTLKIECGPDCGCDPEKCNNRQMSMK